MARVVKQVHLIAPIVPGPFAASDVAELPAEQVVVAIGDGAKAALIVDEHLIKNV